MNKNGEKKLLATVAVFAMVLAMLGAFVFIGSADTDAAVSESDVPVSITKLSNGGTIASGVNLYVDEDVTVTSVNGITADVFIVGTGSLTITTVTSSTVKVHLVTETSSGTPTKYADGLYLVATSGEKISAGTVSDTLQSSANSINAGAVCSMAVLGSSSSIYYPVGYVATADIDLGVGETLVVKNGSVTVVVGSNIVTISEVTGSVSVKNNGGMMEIGGTFTKGSINLSSGEADVVTGFTNTVDCDITISSGAKLGVAAAITNNGKIVIENGAELFVGKSIAFSNQGTIENNGVYVNLNSNTHGVVNGNKVTYLYSNVLYMNQYVGSDVFDITGLQKIILFGENIITVSDVANAIKSTVALTIESEEGTGSLAVFMDISGFNGGSTDVVAISAAGLSVDGVDVSVIIESGSESVYQSVTGIGVGANEFDVYGADVIINVCVSDYEKSKAIVAGDVGLKSATLNVKAGFTGIDVSSLNLSESTIDATASDVAIDATTIDAKISSIINAEAYGFNVGVIPYAIVGTLNSASDSVITSNGMKLEGGSNSATVINNGNTIITGTYTNKAQFINNGIISVFGILENAAGTITNDGEIIISAVKELADYTTTPITIVPDAHSGDANYASKVTLKSLVVAADGSITAKVVVTFDGTADENVTVEGAVTLDGLYLKTFDAVFNQEGVGSGTVSIAHVGTKWQINTTGVVKIDGSEKSVNAISTVNYEDKTVVQNSNAVLKVSGGEFVNDGDLSIDSVCANLVNGGKLINNGQMDVTKSITVSKGELVGDFTVIDGVAISVVGGTIDSMVTYNGQYKAPTSTTVSSFIDVIDLSVIGSGTVVTITATPNANPATAPGSFVITSLINAGEGSEIVVVSGITSITAQTIPAGSVLKVLSDATLTLVGTSPVNGVLAVEDGATINMMVSGKPETYTYGKIDYTISFQKESFTYYCNLAYALDNVESGMELIVSKAANISEDISITSDVTVIIDKNIAVNVVAGKTINMAEGSSFILNDGATIVLGADSVITGEVSYAENVVILDSAVITGTIGTQKATSTLPEAVSMTTVVIKEGVMEVTSGNITGAVDSDVNGKKIGSLVIDEGAAYYVASAGAFTDDAKSVTTVDGTVFVEAATSVNGKITGEGSVVLKNNIVLTFNNTSVADIMVGNGTSAFDFVEVTANDLTASPLGSVTYAVTALTSASKVQYVSIKGGLFAGDVEVIGTAAFNALTFGKGVTITVPQDSILNMETAASTANGIIKVAGTINMRIDGDASTSKYAKLDYGMKYNEGDYTVYTGLVAGIENAQPGDYLVIDSTKNVTDLTIPAGVSIEISEDAVLNVSGCITIGNAKKTLGATAVITGTIKLGANGYLVVFNDGAVDISDAKILNNNDEDAADSLFTVLDEVYCKVYAGSVSVTLTSVSEAVEPAIKGYRFSGWNDVDGEPATPTAIGTEDYFAKMTALKVQVTFTYVDGIIYYVDGKQQNIVGAPVYVDYNAIITAGKLAGYEGTPLVNGETYITVTTSVTITGSFSGTPEPETPAYNVIFVDGTKVETQSVEEGKTAVKPVDPEREGYTFIGWFNGDVEFDFSTPITSDIVLIAVFEEDTPEPVESKNILVSVVSDGTGVKVYLVSLDGGYIPTGKVSIQYYYTIVTPYGPIGFDNTVEVDVAEADISADGRTASVSVDLSSQTGYSGITSVKAAFGDFASEKIIYTPIAVL